MWPLVKLKSLLTLDVLLLFWQVFLGLPLGACFMVTFFWLYQPDRTVSGFTEQFEEMTETV